MKRFNIALGIMLGLAAIVLVWGYIIWNPTQPEDIKLAPPRQKLTLSEPLISLSDPVRGNPAAPATIVEFGDYLCPACKDAHVTLANILEAYKDRVRVVWKDMPNKQLHPLAEQAAIAARCAGQQNKFWEYHDMLFNQQPFVRDVNALVAIAQELKLDTTRFSQCLILPDVAQTVQLGVAEGLALGVDATPYFFIGKERGTMTETQLKKIIGNAFVTTPLP